ncbi:hypothetical protein D3C75_878690 [compost metagenome]
MKKVLVLAALAAALTGCGILGNDYDTEATKQQLKDECKRYGGELNTYRYGSNVRNNPWMGNCINVSTGNKFDVYVPGALK